MSYIIITRQDVLGSINDAELAVALSTASDNASADPLDTIIPSVTAYVRGYVRRRNTLEPVGIPPELQNAAIDLIIYRAACRVAPSLAERRKPAADDADKALLRVADGTLAIAEPTVAATEKTSAASPHIEHRRRDFSPRDEIGI